MSASENGVIRIGRKGVKKFAFGDGVPFDVDVVQAFQRWIGIDEEMRQQSGTIPTEDMPTYHQQAVAFVQGLMPDSQPITIAEALEFIARLRDQYDEVADFFRPKKREKDESPDTSEAALQFSEEEPSPTSMN